MIDYDPEDCARFVSAWRDAVLPVRDFLVRTQGVEYAAEWARQLHDEHFDPEVLEALTRGRDGTRGPAPNDGRRDSTDA